MIRPRYMAALVAFQIALTAAVIGISVTQIASASDRGAAGGGELGPPPAPPPAEAALAEEAHQPLSETVPTDVSSDHAADAVVSVTPESDPASIFARLVSAIRSGDSRGSIALGLILAVALLIRLAPRWKWVKDPTTGRFTDVGGTLFLFGTAFLGAFGSALLAGMSITVGLAWETFTVGVLAAGGYSVLYKKLLRPLIERLVG